MASHTTFFTDSSVVTNGAKVIHIRRLKSDPGVNLLS
ncbi:chemotaxis protein [Salmonella enterica]|nr:chemotaxis protein [Salmonella enterica]